MPAGSDSSERCVDEVVAPLRWVGAAVPADSSAGRSRMHSSAPRRGFAISRSRHDFGPATRWRVAGRKRAARLKVCSDLEIADQRQGCGRPGWREIGTVPNSRQLCAGSRDLWWTRVGRVPSLGPHGCVVRFPRSPQCRVVGASRHWPQHRTAQSVTPPADARRRYRPMPRRPLSNINAEDGVLAVGVIVEWHIAPDLPARSGRRGVPHQA